MKQLKIASFIFSALLFSIAGCLKERDMNIDPDKGQRNVIEFENTGDNIAGATSKFPEFYSDFGLLTSSSTGSSFNVNVSYSGADVAPTDITVNIEIDSTVLDTYNDDNGTDYVVPPADIYSLPTSAVIKQGTRMAQITVPIAFNSSYDFGAHYALPLKIASASTGTISSNFGKAVYSFGVRNGYDGNYTLKGFVSHPNAAYTGGFKDSKCGNWSLVTSGGNSVDLQPGQPFSNNGSLAYFGVYPRFTIDPATNKVSITDAAGSLASLELFPDYDSHYDPATKTIYVKYGWNGSRVAIDTFTYCGSR